MTIPPSAPPVLAEEPAELAALSRIAARLADVRIHDGLSPASCWEAGKALSAIHTAVLAQARQGREDAERLRADAERWRFFKRFLHVETTATEGEYLFSDEPTIAVDSYENTVDSLVDAALAATPSPSPEGGSL